MSPKGADDLILLAVEANVVKVPVLPDAESGVVQGLPGI